MPNPNAYDPDPVLPDGWLQDNFWIEGQGDRPASEILYDVALAAKGYGHRTVMPDGEEAHNYVEFLDEEEAQKAMRALTNRPEYRNATLKAAKILQEDADKNPEQARKYNGSRVALLDSLKHASPAYQPSDPIISKSSAIVKNSEFFPDYVSPLPMRASKAIIDMAAGPEPYPFDSSSANRLELQKMVLKDLIKEYPSALGVAVGKLEAADKNKWDPLHSAAKDKLHSIREAQKELADEQFIGPKKTAALAPGELETLQKQADNLKKPEENHPDQVAAMVRREGTELQKNTTAPLDVGIPASPFTRSV